MDEVQNTIETWGHVGGWEGLYEVSSFGRIRTLKTGRIRIARANSGGYLYVVLSNGTERKTKTIHQMVCEAFHGPRPDGKQVNHIDGCKANNHASNVEWVTAGENIAHAWRTGLLNPPKDFSFRQGAGNGRSILTEADVRDIRSFPDGYSTLVLARTYGIARVTIQKIRSGLLWKHIPHS